jgi:uncharacterized phiE125 gp8 family phage protein
MATLVTLANVKAHLRVTTDDEDTIIGMYRSAAISWVENYTGHVLAPREVVDTFGEWGDYLTLFHQPITVGDPTPTLVVEYTDDEGDFIEYEDRVIRDHQYPWTIHPPYGFTFPSLGGPASIRVTYTAGYGSGEVPDPLNHAVLLLCGHFFVNRSAVSADSIEEIDMSVRSLCKPYRGLVMA